MKITANDALAAHYRIVDLSTGEDMLNVREADDEAGTLTRLAVDDKGQPFPDPDDPSVPAVQHLAGLRLRFDIDGAPGQTERMTLAAYLKHQQKRTPPGRAVAHPKPLPELPDEDDDGPEFPDADTADASR